MKVIKTIFAGVSINKPAFSLSDLTLWTQHVNFAKICSAKAYILYCVVLSTAKSLIKWAFYVVGCYQKAKTACLSLCARFVVMLKLFLEKIRGQGAF